MQKPMFQERMLELKGARGILFIFRELFDLSGDICQNEYRLLEDCCGLLDEVIRKSGINNDTMSVRDFLENKEARKDKERIIHWYEILLECVLDEIPFFMVRYVCDRKWVERCREEYLDSYERQFQEDCAEQEENFWEKYVLRDIEKRYEGHEDEPECDQIMQLMKGTKIFDALMWYCQPEGVTLENIRVNAGKAA